MSKNETNALAIFNALKAEAKALGINIKGMKRPEIEQAIQDAQAKFMDENQDVVDEIPEVKVEEAAPIVETVKVEGVVTAEVKRLGRPIDPNSPRQLRLAEQAKLREEGKLKRGRPTIEGCARQERLKARQEKAAAGIPIKPGRPKMEKPIIPFVSEEDAAKAPTVGIALENELPPQS